MTCGLLKPFRFPASALYIPVFAVLTLAVTACGSNGSGQPDVEAPRDLLKRIVLQVEDLPVGFQRVDSSFSTNTDVADAQLNPKEELAKLEERGRQLGYDVSFIPGPEASPDTPVRGLNNTASLYLTAAGASASFVEGVESARASDWELQYPSVNQLEIREIQPPDLADEALWIRVSGLQGEQLDSLFIDDLLLMRQGRVRGFLRVISLFEGQTDRDLYLSQVEEWARLQSQRMKDL